MKAGGSDQTWGACSQVLVIFRACRSRLNAPARLTWNWAKGPRTNVEFLHGWLNLIPRNRRARHQWVQASCLVSGPPDLLHRAFGGGNPSRL